MSEPKTYSAILIRRLREGKSYGEIVTFALFKLAEGESMDEAMERIAAQEAARHDRIDEVIESTTLRAIYEVLDEFDFSTDESVAAGRPG